jgi:hypothetical protein
MSVLDDPKHWKERAKEARELAAQMADPVAKETMLEVARSYDKLVVRAMSRVMQGRK